MFKARFSDASFTFISYTCYGYLTFHWLISECDAFHTATGYLRLLLRDEDETVIVDEVAVDVLSRGLKGLKGENCQSERDKKTRSPGLLSPGYRN